MELPTWKRPFAENDWDLAECVVGPWDVFCGWGYHDIHRFIDSQSVSHAELLAGDLQPEIAEHLGATVLAEVLATVQGAAMVPAFQTAWARDEAAAACWRALPVCDSLATVAAVQPRNSGPATVSLPGGRTVVYTGKYPPEVRFEGPDHEAVTVRLLEHETHDGVRDLVASETIVWVLADCAQAFTHRGDPGYSTGTDAEAYALGRGERFRPAPGYYLDRMVSTGNDRVAVSYRRYAVHPRSQLQAETQGLGWLELDPHRGIVGRSPRR